MAEVFGMTVAMVMVAAHPLGSMVKWLALQEVVEPAAGKNLGEARCVEKVQD